MTFSKEFLNNRFFEQQMLTVDHWETSLAEDIGVTYRENGDVGICVFAPDEKEVVVELATNGLRKKRPEMKKCEDGCFRGVLAFDEEFTGPANTLVFYDGIYAIDPHIPICWTGNRPFNIIEIPDPEGDYLLVKDVPHGTVSMNFFYAHSMNNFERCTVYTPAGYMKDGKEYPVLYLLNGLSPADIFGVSA